MIRTILKFIDKALPPDIGASKDKVLRTRVIVFILGFDILSAIIVGIFKALTSTPRFDSISAVFGLVALEGVCLYLIKKGYDVGKIIGVYILIIILPFSYKILAQRVLISAGIFIWIPSFTLLLLLLSDWKTRIPFFMLILMVPLACLPLGTPLKSSPPIGGIIIAVFIIALITVGIISVYLKSRNIMQEELDHEIEWQFRNARLAEISAITRSVHFLMGMPLKAFSDEWLSMAWNAPAKNNEISLNKMQQQIEELVRISQSYSWMYRAFQKEGKSSASSDLLVTHLQTLSKIPFDEGGWKWKSKVKAESIEISGPIPSLMLLLFCITIQIVEQTPSEGMDTIQLDVNQKDKWVIWVFSWPEETESQRSILNGTDEDKDALSLGGMRKDLIQDLQQACAAKLLEYKKGDLHVLQVSGAWGQERALSTCIS